MRRFLHARSGPATATAPSRVAVPALARAARPMIAAWATLAVTAGFAAWAGTQYASAAPVPGAALSQARDAALSAGTRELADLNSVSTRSVARWEQRWLDDTAGAEHAKIEQTNPAAAAQIAKVKTSSAATVTGAALTALTIAPGGRTGTARLIATVSVAQTNASGAASTVDNRYLATLTLTTAGWKISSLTGG
jgi:Mce-associated membrane protein